MIKIVALYDQIESGMGTKDDKMLPLGAKKVPIGPGIMMQPYLKQIDAKIVASLYCGTGTYMGNKQRVTEKICEAVNKIHPDVVICGPAFNDKNYAQMCVELTDGIIGTTGIPAVSSMSAENIEVIEKYRDKMYIVKCPKKGQAGLNRSLQNLCYVAKSLAVHDDNTADIKEYCF